MTIDHDEVGLPPWTRRGYRVRCDGCPASAAGALRRADAEAKGRKEGFAEVGAAAGRAYWFCETCFAAWPSGLKAGEFARARKARGGAA
jgi:hypothetical protein